MGKRLHAATKFQVDYVNGHEDFNWMVEETQDLFSALGCEVILENGDDMYGYCDEFEIEKDEFKSAIEKLKNLDSLDEEEKEDIDGHLASFKANGYSVEDIIKSMETFLEVADKKNSFIHFCFF